MTRSPMPARTTALPRGGPIQVRTRLERGGEPRRKRGVNPRNPKRLAKLRAEQFAEQAEVCRNLPCIFCGMEPPSDPQHTVCRGMGGVKGKDRHTIPACRECHRLIHDKGESALPVGHRTLADLLHLTLRLLAERPDLVPAPPVLKEEIEDACC